MKEELGKTDNRALVWAVNHQTSDSVRARDASFTNGY